MKKRLTRRDFLKLVGVAAINFILVTLGGTGYGLFLEPHWLKVETVKLKLPRLPRGFSGLRIAQISDIHMGGWINRERFQRVTDAVIEQQPDIVLITGDFLLGYRFTDADWQVLQDLQDVLSPLARSVPTFAVLGNHDHWMNAPAVRQMLVSSGVTDLTNSVASLTREGENLYICGVDDVWKGDARLDQVIAQLGENHSAAILLAHEPDFADISAATGRFDLQISGHTHGGQVVIPFYGPPVLPHLGHKYPSGLYRVGTMFQYTNRGVGMHRFTFRFNCPPEITLLELESPAL